MATVHEELCIETGLPSIEEEPTTRVVQPSHRPVRYDATPGTATAAASPDWGVSPRWRLRRCSTRSSRSGLRCRLRHSTSPPDVGAPGSGRDAAPPDLPAPELHRFSGAGAQTYLAPRRTRPRCAVSGQQEGRRSPGPPGPLPGTPRQPAGQEGRSRRRPGRAPGHLPQPGRGRARPDSTRGSTGRDRRGTAADRRHPHRGSQGHSSGCSTPRLSSPAPRPRFEPCHLPQACPWVTALLVGSSHSRRESY